MTQEMKPMTFLDAVLAGEAAPDLIDDYVSQWHEGKSKMSLAQFLGFTEEEYANWATNPDTLEHIIEIQRMVRSSRIAITAAVARETDRLN